VTFFASLLIIIIIIIINQFLYWYATSVHDQYHDDSHSTSIVRPASASSRPVSFRRPKAQRQCLRLNIYWVCAIVVRTEWYSDPGLKSDALEYSKVKGVADFISNPRKKSNQNRKETEIRADVMNTISRLFDSAWGEFFTGNYMLWHPPHSVIIFDT